MVSLLSGSVHLKGWAAERAQPPSTGLARMTVFPEFHPETRILTFEVENESE